MRNRLTFVVSTVILSVFVISGCDCTPAGSSTKAQPKDHFFIPKIPPETTYNIHCTVEENGTFNQKNTVILKNTTTLPINRLVFDWPSDGETPYTVGIKNQPLNIVPGYEKKTTPPVMFQLPSPLAPGEQVELSVEASIRFRINDVLSRKSHYTVLNWFPKLWWGYVTHADYNVKLDIPGDLTITTSGRYDPDSGLWKGKNIRSFAVVLGKDLDILEDHAGDVLVRVLHTPKAAECARFLLATAKDVIGFYRERFGFYPYPVLSIIPGISSPAGGFPVATNIVAVHGQETFPQRGERHWKWITAHEIGHQYFIEYVLEKESHHWLVIGLGIYADREWMVARGLGNEKHLGFINRYIKGVREGFDTTAVIHPDVRKTVDFDFNNIVVHGKGYTIISALRSVLGRETFDRIYRRLLRDFNGRELGDRDFIALCEDETGQNLDWFFDQWLYSSRAMSYDIVSTSCEKKPGDGGVYISKITVGNLGDLIMPVPVEAVFTDNSSQVKYTDRFKATNVLIFESPAPLKSAKIDPRGVLANILPPPGLSLEKLVQKIRRMDYEGEGDAARRLLKKGLELKLDRGREWGKLALNLYDAGYYNDALAAFRLTVTYSEEEDPWKMAAVAWQGHIMDILGKRDLALTHYREALTRAGENSMMHSQYNMVIDRRWLEDRLKTPFKR